jgi:hypothetical protein
MSNKEYRCPYCNEQIKESQLFISNLRCNSCKRYIKHDEIVCTVVQKNKLHIHINKIENGFILSDLTEKGKVKKFVATDIHGLEQKISFLIHAKFTPNST